MTDLATSPAAPAVREFVAQQWCAVLGVPDVADDDNFFQLGGHSLTALHLIDIVEQAFQIEIGGMLDLCAGPTLAEFVSLVLARQAGQGAPLA